MNNLENYFGDLEANSIARNVLMNSIRDPAHGHVIHNTVMNEIAEKVKSVLTPDVTGRSLVYIPENLTHAQEEKLVNAYREFTIKFTRKVTNPHGFAAASRKLEYHYLLDILKYNKMQDLVLKDCDVYIKDIGGDFYRVFREEMRNIHCCCPILDARDNARYSSRIANMNCLATTGVVSDFKKHILNSMREGGLEHTTPFVCFNRVDVCPVKARYGLMVQVYEIKLRSLGDAMVRSGMQTIYGSIIYSPDMLLNREGTIPDLECRYEWSEDRKYIEFSFKGDSSWTYKHNAVRYFAYLTTSIFFDSERTTTFALELLTNKCGVQYFRIQRLMFPATGLSTISHKLWMDGLKGKTLVKYFEIDYSRVACGVGPWTDKITGIRGYLRENQCYIDTEIVNRGLEVALGNTENKFKPIEIFNYLRSYVTRIFFGKDVLRRYSTEVDTRELYGLAIAIYIEAYKMKYDQGKVVQQILADVEYVREFSSAGLMKKLFLEPKQTMTNHGGAITYIFHRMIWHAKAAKVANMKLLMEGTQFKNFSNRTENRWRIIFPTEYKAFPTKLANEIYIPDFTSDEIMINSTDLTRRIIKDNFGIDVVMKRLRDLPDLEPMKKVPGKPSIWRKIFRGLGSACAGLTDTCTRGQGYTSLDEDDDSILGGSISTISTYAGVYTRKEDISRMQKLQQYIVKDYTGIMKDGYHLMQTDGDLEQFSVFLDMAYDRVAKGEKGDDFKAVIIVDPDIKLRKLCASLVVSLAYHYRETHFEYSGYGFAIYVENRDLLSEAVSNDVFERFMSVVDHLDNLLLMNGGIRVDDVESIASVDSVHTFENPEPTSVDTSAFWMDLPMADFSRLTHMRNEVAKLKDEEYNARLKRFDVPVSKDCYNRSQMKLRKILKRIGVGDCLAVLDISAAPGGFVREMVDRGNLVDYIIYTEGLTGSEKILKGGNRLDVGSGDLLDPKVVAALRNNGIRYDLVLADACVCNKGDQDMETINLELLKIQCSIILDKTRVGGGAILKCFDLKYNATRRFVTDLACHFKDVRFFQLKETHYLSGEIYIYFFHRSDQLLDYETVASLVREAGSVALKKLNEKFTTFLAADDGNPFDGKRMFKCSPDGACCYHALIASNDEKETSEVISYIRGIHVGLGNKAPYAEDPEFLDQTALGVWGGFPQIDTFSRATGVKFTIFKKGSEVVFSTQPTKWYTHRYLRLEEQHYDLFVDTCGHDVSLRLDYKFSYGGFVERTGFQGDAHFAKCAECCSADLERRMTEGKDFSFITDLDPKTLPNFDKQCSMHRYEYVLAPVGDYFYFRMNFKKDRNNFKISDIVERCRLHRAKCETCQIGGYVAEFPLIKNLRVYCGGKRERLLNVAAAAVDLIITVHKDISKFEGCLGDRISQEGKNVNIYPYKGYKIGVAMEWAQYIYNNNPSLSSMRVKVVAEERHDYFVGIISDLTKEVCRSCIRRLECDLVEEFNPMMIANTDLRSAVENSMYEIREIWRYELSSVLRNVSRVYDEFKSLNDEGAREITLPLSHTVGMIDFAAGRWLFKPAEKFSADGYAFGYDGSGLVSLEGMFREGRPIPCAELGMVMVSDETRIIVSHMLYDRVRNVEIAPGLLEKIKFELISGVPGCGKTREILEKSDYRNGEVLLVTTTREAAEDLRTRASLPRRDALDKIKTLDSAMMTKDLKCRVLWVDEALMSHFGEIAWLAYNIGATDVKMYGDRAQIPYINRNRTYQIHFQRPPEGVPTSERRVSYRCPASVMQALHKLARYPFVPMTAVNRGGSMTNCRITGFAAIPFDDGYHYLTYTQSEKLALKSRGLTHVYTVNEYQGKQHHRIRLCRENVKPIEIYEDLSQITVALSRHTETFEYYSTVNDRTWSVVASIDPNSLEEYTFRAGGKTVGTDMVKVFPRAEVSPVKTYDFLRTNRVIRDIVERHMFPAVIPMKVYTVETAEDYETGGFFCDQPTVSDPIGIMQNYIDRIFPGSSTALSKYDAAIFERDPYYVYADNFRMSDVTPYRFLQRDFLVSRLRTSCPKPVFPTQKQMLKGFSERNGAVPEIRGDRDVASVVESMWGRFVANYIGDHGLLASYRDNPILPNVIDMENWLNSQGTNVMREIERDPDYNIFCKELSVYRFILKRMPKVVLERDGENKYPSSQTIAFVDKTVNLIFCPLVREMKKRMQAVLRDDKIVYSDMSVEGFTRLLNMRFNPRSLSHMLKYFLEVDFSKYDKSQDQVMLEYEARVMTALGVPAVLVNLWLSMHAYTQLWDPQTKFKASVFYQRKSGDAMTFFGNTVILMTVLACVYDLRECVCFFSGDDSLIFSQRIMTRGDACARLASVFNLEAKLLDYSTPYFCSKFLIPVDPDRWVVLPDPVKVLIKLGRCDMVSREHVEEYRISMMDNLKPYANVFNNDALSRALADRYGVGGDHSILAAAIHGFINDREVFHGNYYLEEGAVLPKCNILPSLDI